MGEKWEKERIGMVDEESMRTKRIGFRNSIGRGLRVERKKKKKKMKKMKKMRKPRMNYNGIQMESITSYS